MAGQRYRFALGLVFGSVAPVAVSILIIWRVLDVTPGGLGGALLLGAGFLGVIGPYIVGWIRSYIALVGSATAVLVINDAMAESSFLLMLLACVAAVAAIGALAWFSLRLGHVWRPADARGQAAAKSTMWPYPYV